MSDADQLYERDHEPIAIVGMGCRFPEAGSVQELWQLLTEGRDAIGVYPGHRFPEIDSVYEEFERTGGRITTSRGGFLRDLDRFDARFFEISPREATYMDPQQRLLLETAWDALEDAGQTRESYRGSRTGVFVGLWSSEFESCLYASGSDLDFYVTTGGGRAPAAGRLSYTFGLEGPSLAVDTACSSSLVAVHLACRSLRAGECEMALAGGANIILSATITELFTPAGMLSRDGWCKFGDASADGFVRSEGVGVVVLKRLRDAQAAGDPIYAVIRGTAVNSDGRTNGLMMTPSVAGQGQMLRQAWKDAGIDPKHLRYIEAHGTGTRVGDPTELEALGEALASAGVERPCGVGSLKSNIGHTESAAGIGGLIKTALALRHRLVPRSLHCETPNPKIDWDTLPLRVLTEPLDLSGTEGPILAGVSSFGLTGTNAHAVLEAWSGTEDEVPERHDDENRPYLLTASAHTPEALDAVLQADLAYLRVEGRDAALRDICFTAAQRRTHHEYRAAITGSDRQAVEAGIEAALRHENAAEVVKGAASKGRRRIVFVAPGQGSQWAGMARELYEREPAFRAALEALDTPIAAETGWSLIERLLGAETTTHLEEIDFVQPALFSISVALAALWRSWGVTPDAVVGHSMGEVAAAHIAGILSLNDAAAVICRRSRLMRSIRGSGAMATVELSVSEAEPLLRTTNGLVSVAASNSPRTTILSGDAATIDMLLAELERCEVFARRVNVDVASHSSQVDPILGALREQLHDVAPQPAATPMFSTVTAQFVSGEEMTADYWVRNLRQPVLFAKAVETLANEGHDIFVELSPHPILLPASAATLQASHPEAVIVPCLRRGQQEQTAMLTALGTLYTAGCAMDWNRFYGAGGQCVRLPNYPFQRERYWPDLVSTDRRRTQQKMRSLYGPMLKQRFESPADPDVVAWQAEVDLTTHPWLGDHRVLGSALLPTSAHLELAMEAMRAERPGEDFALSDISLTAAAYLSESEAQEFQLVLRREGGDGYRFEIRSRSGEPQANHGWTLHSEGRLRKTENAEAPAAIDPAAFLREAAVHGSAEEHYRQMARRGLEYGPAFRLLAESWKRGDAVLCRVRANGSSGYVLHPAMLDSCFQSMLHLNPLNGHAAAGDTWLPVAVESMRVFGAAPAEGDVFVHGRLAEYDERRKVFAVDLRLLRGDGSVIAAIDGLAAQRVTQRAKNEFSDSLFELTWQEVTEESKVQDNRNSHCILFTDDGGSGQTLAKRLAAAGVRCTLIHKGEAYRAPQHHSGNGNGAGASIAEAAATTTAADAERVLREAALLFGAPAAVIHLWGLDSAKEDEADLASVLKAQAMGSYHLPAVVQAIHKAGWENPPRMWAVTQGAVSVEAVKDAAPGLAAAPAWGIGRVIAWEHPELRTVLADLSASPSAGEIDALARAILSDEREAQLALRGKKKYAARFGRCAAAVTEQSVSLRQEQEYRIETEQTGTLDHLALRAVKRQKPGRGEVAIEVAAAAVNLLDVTRALGTCPGVDPRDPVALGTECAGRIIEIGEGVTAFQPGDEVIAITPYTATVGMLASQVVVPERVVARKPKSFSFEEAAAAPVAFLTAWHALVELARLRAGEWVLIHAATGGTGLACVEIAQKLGARIIATASSPEKHAWLHSIGVEHVLPSRSLEFADGVMEITGGRGVDVVLNSLTGEFLSRSLDVLAPYGRFVEIGKRDLYDDRRIGMKVFRRNISYHTVDLAAAVEERPNYMETMLRTVIGHLDAGEWKPLPVQCFSAAEPDLPFRFLAQAKQIGKVVVQMTRDVKVLPERARSLFAADATYLITGGMGGVGSVVAEWMARNGARHIVLASRRASSAETQAIIERIERHGAKVVHDRTDVLDADAVAKLIERIREEMPPLRGILHAAVVIDDGLIMDLTAERFDAVMGPKVTGTWNLHEATRDEALEFFVLFSSIAAVLPQAGHGSYAAANAFMDAFAHRLRAQGTPAISINWGGWKDTGLIQEAGTARSLEGYELQGMMAFSPEEALEALREALAIRPVQAVAMNFDPEIFARFHSGNGIPPAFAGMVDSFVRREDTVQTGRASIVDVLAAAETAAEQREILEDHLQQELGRVLRLAPERIERERPLGTLGVDSLMALEFVRRVNAGLGLRLPATTVFNYPTVKQLADQVLQRLGLDNSRGLKTHADAMADASQTMPENAALRSVAALSEDEALALLMHPEKAMSGGSHG
ncbi:type I polyketide synthase [Paracidobacterium acidisoli]|uniref:SDR family NAD(P)-dependent oxidoreductase n=1 Tax=Paracidobacterium acidisoli TaxID=2303751 RepID=A0A372IM24_9BACT|nr:type I polyketide synthase [Paracidobacterium acidisoli]MBT9332220.1 type I polyketide synthase [Paracidobacterium acidisoli]